MCGIPNEFYVMSKKTSSINEISKKKMNRNDKPIQYKKPIKGVIYG